MKSIGINIPCTALHEHLNLTKYKTLFTDLYHCNPSQPNNTMYAFFLQLKIKPPTFYHLLPYEILYHRMPLCFWLTFAEIQMTQFSVYSWTPVFLQTSCACLSTCVFLLYLLNSLKITDYQQL